jgi:hypothetical protein
MADPFVSMFARSALLAFEAQQVIALRMLRLATGGAPANRELTRMITEKADAAAEAGFTAMKSLALGANGTAAALGVIRGYRTRVRRNRRRLAKR